MHMFVVEVDVHDQEVVVEHESSLLRGFRLVGTSLLVNEPDSDRTLAAARGLR